MIPTTVPYSHLIVLSNLDKIEDFCYYQGTTLLSLTVENIDECHHLCQITDKCTFFNYFITKQLCYIIKGAKGPRVAGADAKSGVKCFNL